MKADVIKKKKATTEFSMNTCNKMLWYILNLYKETVLTQRDWIRTLKKTYSLGWGGRLAVK